MRKISILLTLSVLTFIRSLMLFYQPDVDRIRRVIWGELPRKYSLILFKV